MIGGGYVGLVSGACFAEFGTEVAVVETDPTRLAALAAGRMPIYEPGLDRLVADNVAAGRLRFGADLAAALDGAEAVFIAVGTPTRRGDGHADLTYVYAAAEQVARALAGYAVIVTKSTVPVGTGRRIAEIVRATRPDLEFDVASNPEFLREGNAIGDFMRPDRVVIGAETDRARDVLRRLYRPLYLIEAPIVFTAIETAELTKYAANAFLAMKVTFINEIADLCERSRRRRARPRARHRPRRPHRAQVPASRPGLRRLLLPQGHPGADAHRAGTRRADPAGGSDRGGERRAQGGDGRCGWSAACGGSVRGKTIAVLGLTFKPETDDMREAPSVPMIWRLAEDGAAIRAFDPEGMDQARPLLPESVTFCRDAPDAAAGADALVLVTEWNEFRALAPERLAATMRGRVLVDLRNVYDPVAMRAAGFAYHGIGRPHG